MNALWGDRGACHCDKRRAADLDSAFAEILHRRFRAAYRPPSSQRPIPACCGGSSRIANYDLRGRFWNRVGRESADIPRLGFTIGAMRRKVSATDYAEVFAAD
jgi:hypothetical protein